MAKVTCGYASFDNKGEMRPFVFPLKEMKESDVHIQVHYCGMCHSDLHQIRNEWAGSFFPLVPGHEIVGVATAVGSAVKTVKVGEQVAVGCFVESCRTCERCNMGEEQYCETKVTTYNAKYNSSDNLPTYGGYARDIIVADRFVLKVPAGMDLARTAPLLCAGITTYSPMQHFGVMKPGVKVGVVGLGGLGHMAVKFGVAAKCEVTVISTSPSKRDAAIKGLGAHKFLLSNDDAAMAAADTSLDFILDTVSALKNLDRYLALLKVDGTLITVGMPPAGQYLSLSAGSLVLKRRRIAGSLVGGIPQTQEMLEYCAKHGIYADVELVNMKDVNVAMERMEKSDVRYRFVLDVLKTCPTEA